MTSTSCKLEPALWSHDTGQRIPCFDRCQLIIAWKSNIRQVPGKPRLYQLSYLDYGHHVGQLRRNSVAVVVVLRTRPRAIPLAMITMRKSTKGFLFLSYMSMGLRLAALRPAGSGAPLKITLLICQTLRGQ